MQNTNYCVMNGEVNTMRQREVQLSVRIVFLDHVSRVNIYALCVCYSYFYVLDYVSDVFLAYIYQTLQNKYESNLQIHITMHFEKMGARKE